MTEGVVCECSGNKHFCRDENYLKYEGLVSKTAEIEHGYSYKQWLLAVSWYFNILNLKRKFKQQIAPRECQNNIQNRNTKQSTYVVCYHNNNDVSKWPQITLWTYFEFGYPQFFCHQNIL